MHDDDDDDDGDRRQRRRALEREWAENGLGENWKGKKAINVKNCY